MGLRVRVPATPIPMEPILHIANKQDLGSERVVKVFVSAGVVQVDDFLPVDLVHDLAKAVGE